MKKLFIAFLIVLVAFFIAAKNSFPPDATREQFFKWQEETRTLLGNILYNGRAPEAVPLSPVFGDRETRVEYEITKVEFHDRPGHTTKGFLARPLNPVAEKLPAVLALHGHDFSAHDTFDPGNMYYYGDMLASRGYIVMALEIGHDFLDHDKPLRGWPEPLPKNVAFPPMGQRVWMVKRAIDFLETLPDVDKSKIGVVGLSNGGMTSMFAGAMDQRIKLTVAAGSLTLVSKWWHPALEPCRCEYLEKMDGVLEYYDVFALIAPRPLVVQNGIHDRGFPVDWAKEAFTHIKQAYTIAGAPDMAYHDVHDRAHNFRREVPLQWFEKYLPLK